jgi:uncharacterized protein YkwD
MKHISLLSVVLLSGSLITTNAAPVLTGTPAPVAQYTANDDYSKMARKGLRPLTMNSVATAEAQKHSENMAAHRTSFGHNGFARRMKNISSQVEGVNETAENVAYGSTSARMVVDQWLKSPMHKQNIEGPYKLTGIGIAPDRKGDLFFTQIFINN